MKNTQYMKGGTNKMKTGRIRHVVAAGLGALIGLMPFSRANAGEEIKFSKGFNSAELTRDTKDNTDARLITNASVDLADKVKLGYHGLNNLVLPDSEDVDGAYSHAGIQRFYAGVNGFPLQALARCNTDKEGIVDESWRYGIRNTTLPKLIGCGGFVNASYSPDRKDLNLTTLLSKGFGGFYASLMQSVTHATEEKLDRLGLYTEAEVGRNLGKGVSAFVRTEVPWKAYDLDLDEIADKATTKAGLKVTF